MEPKNAETLSSEYIEQHQYFNATRNAYRLASGKIVDPYFVVELPSSACVLGITKDKKCILVKQYRYPVNEILYELPGGFIEPNEFPELAVLREMEEETGHVFKEAIALGFTYANPGVLNNKTHLFLALDGTLEKIPSLDMNEEISIELVDLYKLKQMLKGGEFLQSMHALCIYRALEKLGELSIK